MGINFHWVPLMAVLIVAEENSLIFAIGVVDKKKNYGKNFPIYSIHVFLIHLHVEPP